MLLLSGVEHVGRRSGGERRLLILSERYSRGCASSSELVWRSRARVGGGVDVSRYGRRGSGSSVLLEVPEEAQPRLDRRVLGVEIECSPVGIDGVGDLVVARLIE